MISKFNIFPLLAILWALTILIFSGLPGNAIKLPPIWNLDKILHLIVYLILSILVFYSFHYKRNSISRYRILFLTIVPVIAYGGIIEILQQHLFVGRYGDILDFTANSFGAVLGSLIPFMVAGFKSR